jgi:hypothetical protein
MIRQLVAFVIIAGINVGAAQAGGQDCSGSNCPTPPANVCWWEGKAYSEGAMVCALNAQTVAGANARGLICAGGKWSPNIPNDFIAGTCMQQNTISPTFPHHEG